MRNFAIYIGIVLLVSGCASGTSLYKERVRSLNPEAQAQYEPDLNVEVSAEIGDTLISRSYVKKVPAIRIKNKINHSSDFLTDSLWVIPEGILVKYAEGNSGSYYSANDGKFYRKNNHLDQFKIGLILENDKSISTDKIYIRIKTDGFHYTHSLNSPVEVEMIKPIEISGENNFKRELIYTGISNNVITVIYREFKNDFARPAFSQELKYDLSEGKEIGFKGSRFQVLSATNVGIKYKVLKNLD